MDRTIALSFTVSLINELNTHDYDLKNFDDDSAILMKLLSILEMGELEENLDLVKSNCEIELRTLGAPKNQLTHIDKKAILRYL